MCISCVQLLFDKRQAVPAMLCCYREIICLHAVLPPSHIIGYTFMRR